MSSKSENSDFTRNEVYTCDGGELSQSASLVDFVRRIQNRRPSNKHRNKPLAWAAFQPKLIKGQTNRIMVFHGSFNPPHVAHLNLLTHAYYCESLEIRAAIITTTSDSSLNGKADKQDEKIRFTQQERMSLWKDDSRLPDWAWVFEDSSDEWRELRRRLKEEARSAGYILEYLHLYGPDGLALYERFVGDSHLDKNYRSSDYDKVLVCDVSRRAESLTQNAKLRSLAGFVPWKRLKLDEQLLEREVNAEAENMLAILKANAPEEHQKAVERGGKLSSL